MANKSTRRQFLGTTAAAAATSWAGAKLFAAGAGAKPGPNDTINLGWIGCGARGRQILPSFMQHPGARIVAVCDVHSQHLAEVRQQAGGEKILAYRDYRKVLENKDIDAVIIATQAHWHVLITIAACQAGKDVYVEKPLGNFIGEGRFAIEAAKKYDRIVQIGTQQRSREHYHKAAEIIQSGKLGEISEVKVWDYENWWPGVGSPADCDPPAELDWDFYVGPSPYRNYNPNIYSNYGLRTMVCRRDRRAHRETGDPGRPHRVPCGRTARARGVLYGRHPLVQPMGLRPRLADGLDQQGRCRLVGCGRGRRRLLRSDAHVHLSA